MARRLRCFLAIAALCVYAAPAPDQGWAVARSEGFEVYSQAGEQGARETLELFERLRAFFTGPAHPVRIVAFRSIDEYNSYRLRPTADAYYVGTEARDTIVMPGPAQFNIAAHEYAHVLLHSQGEHMPSWLNEGLAEVFSSVRIGPRSSSIGGVLPARAQTVRNAWMALPALFSVTSDSGLRNDRQRSAVFYAESWALAHMLTMSPEYRGRFQLFVAALAQGQSSEAAFAAIYGKTVDAITRDLRAWVGNDRFTPVSLPGAAPQTIHIETAMLSPRAARLLLAELLLETGELARSEGMYRELAREAPEANISAALGTIALKRGDRDAARVEWRRALDAGIADATLCYRYAVLAQEAGISADEARPALERAVALKPDFDDAHYLLALLDMNSGRHADAVAQFRAMRTIAPQRRFAYWTGLGYCLNELDRREEAKAAARQAERYAETPEEHVRARDIAYIADTDFAVRFSRDAQGRPQIITARAPHGRGNWNPFIEPADHMRRAEGLLREIRCTAGATRFIVAAEEKELTLVIADPTRVQMRNAPPEFTCGPQKPPVPVNIDYAAKSGDDSDGIVRGVEFVIISPHTAESQSRAPSPDPQ
jgi:tetratricopeptide (TPR) repeat protein